MQLMGTRLHQSKIMAQCDSPPFKRADLDGFPLVQP